MKQHTYLYHKSKNGSIHTWKAWVDGDTVFTEFGLMNGKKQISQRQCFPKNVGKKNSTTSQEQALIELDALYNYQLERKYKLTIEEANVTQLFPMLASNFEDKKKDIKYPCYIQPKLDGVRCLSFLDENGEVVLLSRGGKPYNVPHIKEQLKKLFIEMNLKKNVVLDGELYIHEETFQNITSLVKKNTPESSRLEYWIYDIALETISWSTRLQILLTVGDHINRTIDKRYKSLKIVNTNLVQNETDVLSNQIYFVKNFYEGAIVRTSDHVYRFGYRSDGLLKVKSFKDAEYLVIGYHAGEGSYSNFVIWECLDGKTGKTFNVNPKGNHKQKEQWLKDGDQYINEYLKVKYFDLTDDGLPRFPVGIGFRMKEDI